MTLEEKAKLVLERREEYKKYVPQTTREVSQYIIENVLDYIDKNTEKRKFDSVIHVQFIPKYVSVSSAYEMGSEKDITPERYMAFDEKAIYRVYDEVKDFFKLQYGYKVDDISERIFGTCILKITIED